MPSARAFSRLARSLVSRMMGMAVSSSAMDEAAAAPLAPAVLAAEGCSVLADVCLAYLTYQGNKEVRVQAELDGKAEDTNHLAATRMARSLRSLMLSPGCCSTKVAL